MADSVSYITLDGKGRATLPEFVRESLGVGPGDLVLLERTDRGTYELVPASLVPRDQLWFHHPEVRSRVAGAEADLAAGRASSASTPEAAQAILDGLKRKKARKARR
jgi:AbrB family looped-hinge helix DNA binding protein